MAALASDANELPPRKMITAGGADDAAHDHDSSSFPTPAASSSLNPKPNNKPALPWKTRIAIALLSHVTDFARRSDGSINRRLLHFLDFTSPPTPSTRRGHVSSSDITVDPARHLWFRLFSPSSPGPLPVIFFFHGGGFAFLSPASSAYDAVCRRLSRELPAIIISVNYRLSPEHRFPAQYDDGFDVLRYVDEHPYELPQKADLGRCFLAGDSAGANIAHHVAVRVCKSSSSSCCFEAVRIRGLISIQPFFGGEERTEAEIRLRNAPVVSVERTDLCWKGFLPEGEDRDHWAANVSGPKAVDIAGVEGFPAVLLFVAGFDPLRDWQKRYYEWLKRSGKEAEMVEYPNSIHAFYVFPELPESAQLVSEMKNFVDRKIKSSF
ncbi:probable carboxylesterase 18 [Punica granatum]|uniref:Uncharacterized protein n=2 Tax=Punica granatum TaxID=22663 RepID=A0A2I0I7R8_PUNGR|nr:probable carboxylesterase 18 [Punica granatum]PKI39710.1 hypothetical protein CRG98_039880 [Punica granatum]